MSKPKFNNSITLEGDKEEIASTVLFYATGKNVAASIKITVVNDEKKQLNLSALPQGV